MTYLRTSVEFYFIISPNRAGTLEGSLHSTQGATGCITSTTINSWSRSSRLSDSIHAPRLRPSARRRNTAPWCWCLLSTVGLWVCGEVEVKSRTLPTAVRVPPRRTLMARSNAQRSPFPLNLVNYTKRLCVVSYVNSSDGRRE
jgi:hypothetical protein